jgi:hypothetical protein
MPWLLYCSATFLVLLLCHGWWGNMQRRRAVSCWLKARGEVLLRMKDTRSFDMLIYDVDARRADGSIANYHLGIDYAFLTGRVREIMEMDTYSFKVEEE